MFPAFQRVCRFAGRFSGLLLAALLIHAHGALLPQVNPRRNVDEFPPVKASAIRFSVFKTNSQEPCLDELEVFTAGPSARNVALATAGAKLKVSGSLSGYGIHKAENINDGLYGNGHSWLAAEPGRGWVIVEFAAPELVHRVVWGRDREGKFIDRLPTEYSIEVLTESGAWQQVASSANRKPLETGAEFFGVNPAQRVSVNRFVPMTTSLPSAAASNLSEYSTTVWQIEDGLPSNTISAIAQTRDGYLWLGTFNGLVRFDGVRFTVFGEADGLQNPRIVCLHEDRAGNLWIGTEGGGLARYDGETFTHFTTEHGLANNVVLSIAQDGAGALWIGTMAGVSRLMDGKLSAFNAAPAGVPIYRIIADRNGDVWLMTGQLLFFKNGVRADLPISDEPASFTSLHSIHEGLGGSIWLGGANGYVARAADGQTTVFGNQHGLPPDIAWEIFQARNGDLWVGTASAGLSRLRDGRFTTFTTQDGLSDNSIRSIFEDHEGNLWIGTNSGGLMRLRAKKLTAFTTRHGLSHDVIMSLAEDRDGRIWAGSNCGGLNVWQNGAFTNHSVSYLLDNECIWSLCSARDGALWIGTWGAGLFRQNGDSLVNFASPDVLPEPTILSLCEDHEGAIWIGTYSGALHRFHDGEFTRQPLTSATEGAGHPITSIIEESPGRLWVGTSGGGLILRNQQEVIRFTRREGLSSDFVRTLFLDRDGILWIGTSGGLSILKDKKLASFTTSHGLVNDVISQILEDDLGFLWLGSNHGISRIAKREFLALRAGNASPAIRLNPVSFGKAEGMESLECTGGFHQAGLKALDGTLWFSTVKGVVRVDPRRLELNQAVPKIAFEELLLDGRRISKAALANGLSISPRVQRLELRYTALSFAAPEKVMFRHKLEGLDKDWVEAGTRRSAAYTRLPPGDYQFHLTACNNDGVWNPSGLVLALTVLPPVWQTWWFRGLAGVLGVGMIGGAVRYISLRNMRSRLARLEQEHALEKERSRIARDIHDDLGAGLTQILLLSELGQKNGLNKNEMQTSFGQIASSARGIVQSMDAIVWAVNPRNDTLDNTANYLPHFAKEFLASSGIRCRIDIPALLPHFTIPAEVRHNLLMTAQEALNNVLKHSGASEVWLRLSLESGALCVIIEDNGAGFDPAVQRQSRGNGLKNMTKRMEEVGGGLEIESAPGRGTKIKLRLPTSSFQPSTSVLPG